MIFLFVRDTLENIEDGVAGAFGRFSLLSGIAGGPSRSVSAEDLHSLCSLLGDASSPCTSLLLPATASYCSSTARNRVGSVVDSRRYEARRELDAYALSLGDSPGLSSICPPMLERASTGDPVSKFQSMRLSSSEGCRSEETL